MRCVNMVRYHWRRNWKIMLFFAALMLVISTATLLYVRAEYASNMVVFSGGVAHVEQGYSSVNMSFNYSFLFVILLWATAVNILRQERAFFITASSTRWEFVLSLAGFIATYALALTVVTWLIGVINRLEMPLLGMRVRQGMSAGLIFTGNNELFAKDMLLCFTGMLAAAGWATFIYALFARWWKQLLILMGAGIVVLIVLGLQVRLGMYTANMAAAARALVYWLQDVFIPKVVPIWEQIFGESRTWVLVLRDLAQFAVGFILVYPIILRMRVKN